MERRRRSVQPTSNNDLQRNYKEEEECIKRQLRMDVREREKEREIVLFPHTHNNNIQ